ncbi:hypothetical protein ACFY1P_08145 [Streptomyces sp. NPDC001407]|uniref:hypothetical protein n=1 Tax=Streptomyces sp. NPDC001407 TaxID=3364573 RepID=UPI00369A1B0A
MAKVSDALEVANWMFLRANSDEEVPFPEPVPRPGQEKPEEKPKKMASTVELSSFLNHLNSQL